MGLEFYVFKNSLSTCYTCKFERNQSVCAGQISSPVQFEIKQLLRHSHNLEKSKCDGLKNEFYF